MGEGRGTHLPHLGDVLKYRRKMLGDDNDTGNDNFMTMGFMFEMFVAEAMKKYIGYSSKNLIVPGEMELDGILMNPDRFDTKAKTLYEFKATWFSMVRKKKPERGIIVIGEDGEESVNPLALQGVHVYWLWQVMAYCWAMGVSKARLVIFFLNGDYTFKQPYGGPQFRAIDLSFDEYELKANWKAILRDRDEMLAAA